MNAQEIFGALLMLASIGFLAWVVFFRNKPVYVDELPVLIVIPILLGLLGKHIAGRGWLAVLLGGWL